MIIRPGLEQDVVKVSRLWLEMVAELAPTYTPNVGWWRTMALQHLRGNRYHIFVADLGGRLVGFIDFFFFPEPSTGKIHAVGQHFYLTPEFRGQGVGRDLYQAAIELATPIAQVVELFAFSAQTANWEKQGYKPVRTLLRKEL